MNKDVITVIVVIVVVVVFALAVIYFPSIREFMRGTMMGG
jgi:hypothetical protein